MGANMSALLPQAVSAAGQGYLAGRGQRTEEDQIRHEMMLRNLAEARAAEEHPLAMQGRRDALAREPLMRETLEQGLRGGRPVSPGFAGIVEGVTRKGGKPGLDVANEDRDTAELVYRLESERASAAERARLGAANQQRDDELRAWTASRVRNNDAVDTLDKAAATAAANTRAASSALKGLYGEQKKQAEETLVVLRAEQLRAERKAQAARADAARSDQQFRGYFKKRYGVDPAGIEPETIQPQQGGGVLGGYTPPVPQGGQ